MEDSTFVQALMLGYQFRWVHNTKDNALHHYSRENIKAYISPAYPFIVFLA
jgi:hypothetical protein